MSTVGRTLSAAEVEALTYWPGIVHAVAPQPADLDVLPPLLDELLAEWPWWNREWRVTAVKHARPHEIVRDEPRAYSTFTEVGLPGMVGNADGGTLPLYARIRFVDDHLIQFHAKVDNVVIGPASTPAGQPEPHPFGAVLTRLMDARGKSVRDVAQQSGRSMSTIHMLRHGSWNPHQHLVAELAEALNITEADLFAIAGIRYSHSAANES